MKSRCCKAKWFPYAPYHIKSTNAQVFTSPEPQTVWLVVVSLWAQKHASTSCGGRTKEFWDLYTTTNEKKIQHFCMKLEVQGSKSHSKGRHKDSICQPNFTTPSCKTEWKEEELQMVPVDVVKWLKRTVRQKNIFQRSLLRWPVMKAVAIKRCSLCGTSQKSKCVDMPTLTQSFFWKEKNLLYPTIMTDRIYERTKTGQRQERLLFMKENSHWL